MPFWTYMLQCADRTFYVGHTDDLRKRIGQHEMGEIPGYTADRRPISLVWSEAFTTREEARDAGLKLKGWGRLKKLALIRGDWELIQALAKGKKRASTSSAKSVCGTVFPSSDLAELVEAPSFLFLRPHPDHIPSQPFSLEVGCRKLVSATVFHYRLTGDMSVVTVPELQASERQDGLWQHTCFEVFLRHGGDDAYVEFNLSPSKEWAAYRFDDYRKDARNLDVAAPEITVEREPFALSLTAKIVLPPELDATHLALSAVIEENDGTKSYWALRHPPGPPDFHHPDCFALTLPAPGQA